MPIPPITKLDQTLTFGKYKGETVRYVLDEDPSYLLWVAQETNIDIHVMIIDLAQEAHNKDTYGEGWSG